MAEEENNEEAPKSGKKGLIIMIAVVALAVGASIGGTLYFVKQGQADAVAEDAEPVSEAPAVAIYHQMRPSFIVNYVTDTKPRYLQAELAVMARDPALIEALIDHTPLIRSRILKELSDAKFEVIRTNDGKEALRENLLASLNDVIAQETDLSGLESVLFTNFVLQ